MPDKVHRDRNRQNPTLVDLPPVELESNVAVKEPRHESDAEKRPDDDRRKQPECARDEEAHGNEPRQHGVRIALAVASLLKLARRAGSGLVRRWG